MSTPLHDDSLDDPGRRAVVTAGAAIVGGLAASAMFSSPVTAYAGTVNPAARNKGPLGARLQGVQHFGVTVQNMDRAFTFYTEVLGGTEVMRDGDFHGERIHNTLLADQDIEARARQVNPRTLGIPDLRGGSQRLADGYIDVLGARLTMWQAAWRLAEGLPAEREVAIAKLWAADAGHRVAHTTVHVHGGVGIDLDGEAHRFFTGAKRNEFALGGATEQARTVGRLLAAEA